MSQRYLRKVLDDCANILVAASEVEWTMVRFQSLPVSVRAALDALLAAGILERKIYFRESYAEVAVNGQQTFTDHFCYILVSSPISVFALDDYVRQRAEKKCERESVQLLNFYFAPFWFTAFRLATSPRSMESLADLVECLSQSKEVEALMLLEGWIKKSHTPETEMVFYNIFLAEHEFLYEEDSDPELSDAYTTRQDRSGFLQKYGQIFGGPLCAMFGMEDDKQSPAREVSASTTEEKESSDSKNSPDKKKEPVPRSEDLCSILGFSKPGIRMMERRSVSPVK